jgi:hypothetical protein
MVALSTFVPELQGRRVVLYSDSRGAEHATAKGSAKAFDHNQLVHEIWTQAMRFQIHLWVQRVPSEENIADLPSKCDYRLLKELGATHRKPVLAQLYLGD